MWKQRRLLLWWVVLAMAVRTLTFTPAPTVAREAITETQAVGNDGYRHLLDPAARPFYRFSLEVGPLIKHEAESLSALHAYHMGHRAFLWDGAQYHTVPDYGTAGEGDGLRKEFLLPHRYIGGTAGASSLAVRTLRPSTGATSNWATSAWSLYASVGLLKLGTAPVSGDLVQAKYANLYRVNFAPDGVRLEQVAKDLYMAQFELVENPITPADIIVIPHQVFYQVALAAENRANAVISLLSSAVAQAARGLAIVTSGSTTLVISTGLTNSAYVTLVPHWNTTWYVASRSSTHATVVFGTQVGSGGSKVDWGTFV